jgi:ribonucleotide reductase small subunit/alkyl sulfatase-like protein
MSVAAQTKTGAVSYQDLYERWEQGNWQAYDIDFSGDRAGWEALTEIQRKSGLWTYSMFFYGEDAVTDGLSLYIEAAPKEEQKYFLATQQVDEARHAVFFHRFFKEVIGTDGSIGETLDSTLPELNWCYRQVFGRLEQMSDELVHDRSLPKFAQAIALYHMVIEATLAQPGQHFIEDFFNKQGTMPGFSGGMVNVSRDEQRHIAFGVKALSEMFAGPEGDECKAAVNEVMREVMQYTLGVFVPPDFDLRYTREYGFELEDIYAFGMKSIEAKWRATGYPIDEMPPGIYPFDPSTPHEERARRAVILLKAGIVGDPHGHPEASPEIQELFFDVVKNAVNHEAAGDKPMTIQWRFTDADPWHLSIDNGSTRVAPGEAPKADVTLDSSWEDFVAISSHGQDPRRAILRRKVRPHGSPRKLLRMQKLFAWGPPA